MNLPKIAVSRQWYEDYKEKCSKISYLNEENFFDMNWNSELDAFAERFLKKMSIETVYERLKIVDEDERRRRIELWLKRNPVDIFCDFGVEALKDYFLLLFPDYSLAVFDSFYSGNAYYVFNYIDIEELLSKISKLSKTGMQQKSDLINRGYHIANLERLEEKISKYFVRPIEG